MCDQTEVSYLPGDIVWVKLGPVWWPGKVCSNDEIPPEVFKELRKTPIAIVKFFQEESFEYVKKLSNIYHYNCLKKNEFIKKGLDLCRSSNRDTPSNMKLFPEDIVTAEGLTGGNPNIIHDEMFLPEKRPSYAADFMPTPKKTPKKLKIERKKDSPSKSVTPRVITHPRFIRHGICDYEVRERKQVPLRAECDEEDNSPPTTYKCPDCDFTTIRLNVIVLHNKSHVRNYATVTKKGVKRKSTTASKFKERKYDRDESKPKVPKTEKIKPKTPSKKLIVPEEPKKDEQLMKPVKKRKIPPPTDEFQNSLLEDWAEFENEQEVNQENGNQSNEASEDNSLSEFDTSSSKDKEKNKSCFDFDDSDDSIVIDKSKIKFGRKIPRILDEKDKTLDENDPTLSVEKDETPSENDSTVLDDKDEIVSMETEEITSNSEDSNKSGIKEDEDYAAHKSELQEMGVDNEIEINSEEVPEPKEDLVKQKETEELKQKVDKLLEEISTPSKLPDIPYSVKKAHLKSFTESEEAKKEAALNNSDNSNSNGSIEKPTSEKPNNPTADICNENGESVASEASDVNGNKSPKNIIISPTKVKLLNQSTPIKVSVSTTIKPTLSKIITLKCAEGEKMPDKPTIINKVKNFEGKNVVINLPLAGQSTPGSSPKILISKAKSNVTLDPAVAAKLLNTTILPKIPVSGQKVRLTPNILQKSIRSPRSPAKSVVLQSNLPGSNVVLLQPQKSVVFNVPSEPVPQSEEVYQVVDVDLTQQNNVYIADSSATIIDVPDVSSSCVTTKEDILAKALENTDVLQTEMALTDTFNVPPSASMYKSDNVYETNLTLNTPPIMSAFEAPSRALNATAIPEVSNEIIIINPENNDFVA